jgi:AcrR family transcriptional regulator
VVQLQTAGPESEKHAGDAAQGQRYTRAHSRRGEAAVLEKGFAATSIEELIAAVGITKSGFFYHFKDKNELAKALTIDSSVFERWRYDPKYHPANLAAWARRYDIDVASLVGSFSTDSRLTISD